MGRWGHYMFECDADEDLCCMIENDIKEKIGKDVDFSDKEQHGLLRKMLDDGIAKQLFTQYRAKPHEFYGEYQCAILGMMCMLVGASIDEDDMTFLKSSSTAMESVHGYHLPICDPEFRDQGKVQFTTALENYKNGEPREHWPSCFACGKIEADLGKPLSACKRCKCAHYCNKECQRQDWRKHKNICPRDPKVPGILCNV